MIRVLWLSVGLSLIVVVITIPLFEGIVGLFRYDPPAGILSGLGRQRRDWGAYSSIARLGLFLLYALLIAFSGLVGHARAGQAHRGGRVGISTALAVLLYLVITMPVVDFAHACIVGEPALLPMAC